ncbi:MAG: ADP-ribosylglycohydrolase family protein [Phycisphaerae bacterium]|nr:ADP-ribosylglycohydrolase family protein [Phycisphaerae bacterium]
MNNNKTIDRFRGCLVGHAVADALGSPFEGLDAGMIYHEAGDARAIVAKPPLEKLYYSDDTQMMLAVAETLIQCEQIDLEYLCENFANNFDNKRGYGASTQDIIEEIQKGGNWEQWQKLSRQSFPNGSYGNGAAMRVAPVGLKFYSNTSNLIEQTKLSALPTHVHPLGIESAVLMALAVGYCVSCNRFDKNEFYNLLQANATQDDFQWALSLATELEDDAPLQLLGNGIEAHRSVVTAMVCFTHHLESYSHTIASAIGLGGDTDTIAAMAGSLSGAYLGIKAIPKNLINLMENDHKGISYIDELAQKLYK